MGEETFSIQNSQDTYKIILLPKNIYRNINISCNNGDFWNLFTSGGEITITRNKIQYENLNAIDLHYITRSFGEDNCKTAPTGLPIARAADKRKDIFLNLLSMTVSETSMIIS